MAYSNNSIVQFHQLVTKWREMYDIATKIVTLNDYTDVTIEDGTTRPTFYKEFDDRWKELIGRTGYDYIGDYEAGVEFTDYFQIVRGPDNEFWRPANEADLPYTTTGAGLDEGGNLIPVGDAYLRADFEDFKTEIEDIVNEIVDNSGASVSGYSALKALSTDNLPEGKIVSVLSRGDTSGGGSFFWTSSNITAMVTDDPQEGLFVAPSSDPTGASGGWIRIVGEEGVCPEMFGALGDGLTDDYVALDAMVHHSRVHRIWSGAKNYLISDTLFIDATFEQAWYGHDTVISIDSDFTDTTIARFKNAKKLMRGVEFNGGNVTGVLGLNIESTAEYSDVRNCHFIDIARTGLQCAADFVVVEENLFDNCGRHADTVMPFRCSAYFPDSSYFRFDNNRIHHSSWGVYARGTNSTTRVGRYSISGNEIVGSKGEAGADTTAQGISNQYPNFATIHNNIIRDFDDNAIDLYGGEDCTVSHNISTNCKDGVFIGHQNSRNITVVGHVSNGDATCVRVWDTGSWYTITGCTSYNPRENGFRINASGQGRCVGVVIEGCAIRNTGGSSNAGIRVANAEMCTIRNNVINSINSYAIRVESASDLITVGGNMIQNSSSGTNALSSSSDCNRVFFDDNTVYGAANNGIVIGGGTGNRARGNRARGISGSVIVDNGTTPGGVTSSTIIDNESV